VVATQRLPPRPPPQQIWQLRHVRGNAPGFVAGEQIGGRATTGVALEIYVGERLAVVVLDDEAGRVPKTEAQLGYKRLIQL
jgi:hypothetical protein